jgi:hypothetical protein
MSYFATCERAKTRKQFKRRVYGVLLRLTTNCNTLIELEIVRSFSVNLEEGLDEHTRQSYPESNTVNLIYGNT